MNKTYRHPRFQLFCSAFGTLFFCAGTVGCLVLALFAPREEILWAGLFWWLTIPYLGFLAFFAWRVWADLRCRLHVTDDGVTLVTLKRTRIIRFQDLTSAHWRPSPPGGALILSTATDKITIAFGHYGWKKLHELQHLIRFFRTRIPEDLQQDWDGSVCQFHLTVEPLLFE